MTEWFARPVLHVSNVEASLRFYVDRLSFSLLQRDDRFGHESRDESPGTARQRRPICDNLRR